MQQTDAMLAVLKVWMDGPLIFKVGRHPATSWANDGKFIRKIRTVGAIRYQIL